MKRIAIVAACLLGVWGVSGMRAAEETPHRESVLVGRVRAVMSEMLHRLPDYTCVETIERTTRGANETKYKRLDKVRVEVAYYKGSELYAWPGAPRLEARDLAEMVGGEGAIGTGDFALHLMAAYRGNAPLHFAGEETLHGRKAYKFTQDVPMEASNFTMSAAPVRGVVGYRVTAWHAADTLDLLRFELTVTEFPSGMPLRKTFKAIDYQLVKVGESEFLLPATTDLTTVYANGVEGRTVSTFAHCRQYLGESTITFGDIDPGTGRPAERPPMKLPEGVKVPVRLNQDLDLTKAARGDLVEMAVSRDVLSQGHKVLERGAKVEARVEGVYCETKPYSYCFLLMRGESYDAAAQTGPFLGLLEQPTLEQELLQHRKIFATPGEQIPDEVIHAPKDLSVLLATGDGRLARGYPMIWRTLEIPGGPTP